MAVVDKNIPRDLDVSWGCIPRDWGHVPYHLKDRGKGQGHPLFCPQNARDGLRTSHVIPKTQRAASPCPLHDGDGRRLRTSPIAKKHNGWVREVLDPELPPIEMGPSRNPVTPTWNAHASLTKWQLANSCFSSNETNSSSFDTFQIFTNQLGKVMGVYICVFVCGFQQHSPY